MATQTETGTIAAWKDDRGFGFIRTKSENKEDDVFIHISSLNNMSRRPRIGDVIHYDLTEENGKTKAVNAIIEGVEPFSDGENFNDCCHNRDYFKCVNCDCYEVRIIKKGHTF